MARNFSKKMKYANVFRAAKESSNKAADSIGKKPTTGHLLKFALPTILSMLIMSTFGIVDGIFVSRVIDQTALAAVVIVFPFLSFVMAIGFMLGVGGNALVAKKIGEGQAKEGRENFSLIALTAFIVSLAIALIGIFFPSFILGILGADDHVYYMAREYMMPLLYFMPPIILGMVFQQFLITEGKAHISAIMAFLGGLTSAGLNYLFIYLLDMGLQGAALATSIGYTLPAIVGVIYFTFKRTGNLYFVKPKLDFRALGRACINGASEMVTMLATSIVTVLLNNILMDIDGGGIEAVSAAGIIFAGMGIFAALFVGYSSGVIPIISYNFGKNDKENLGLTYRNSLKIIGVTSLLAIGLALLSTDLLLRVYGIPAGTAIHDMTRTGFTFLVGGFIFMGFNTFASMFFTALNNGVVSSILSLFRTLIFVSIAFATLPPLFGLTGAWMSMPAAEVLAITLTIFFFVKMKKKYGYA
ncbi:MAG: MATE family efflux transporter [Defluviitaleaceae bacterium]|nr:MATE family efflux transporter [Defluviitaleaceae bacterium]